MRNYQAMYYTGASISMLGGGVALYGAVVVWLGFVYSICYTGSFHQLCESVLFVFIVRVKSAFAFFGKKYLQRIKKQ